MKILPTLLVIAGAFFSCQQQQFFNSSPEIDLIKKCDETYLKGDWAANRAFYHDTAAIYVNTWDERKLSPDQTVELFKTAVAEYKEYALGDDRRYEMVVTPDGQHWVHCWSSWRGIHKNGKEVKTVVNIAWRVEDSKIVFAGFIFDNLPNYLASQNDTLKVVGN